MTYFRPCKNCVRATAACDRRDQVRGAIKGVSITSVAFRCDQRVPIFAVGQRVLVHWIVPDPEGDYRDATEERWPATVVAERGTKFQIIVDDVPSDYETPARGWIKNESLHAKVTATKLEPLDEPTRKVCGVCEECDLSRCPYADGGVVAQRGCVRFNL
jgi:hypothetical protein